MPQTSVKCQEIQVVIVGAEDDVVPAKSGYNTGYFRGFSSISELLQAILNNFMVAGLVQAFFVRFQKNSRASEKNSRPILGKKLNLLEANSDFTKKTQEISYPNYGFSWGSHVLGHFYYRTFNF